MKGWSVDAETRVYSTEGTSNKDLSRLIHMAAEFVAGSNASVVSLSVGVGEEFSEVYLTTLA